MGVVHTVEWAMCTVWLFHSKWLSKLTNKSALNFALSLNIPLRKRLDDSEGHSYGQLVIGSFITTMRPLIHHVSCRIFGKTLQYSDDSGPLQPIFGALWLLAFPKTKITFEGERFQTINEIHENTTGQLMVIGRTVWGPKAPTLKGRHHCPMYNVSCILYLLQ